MEGLVKSIYKPFHHIFLLDHDELNNRKLFYQQDYPLKNYYFVMSILIHSQHFDQLKNWMKITLIQLRKIPYNELKRLEFLDQSGSEWFFGHFKSGSKSEVHFQRNNSDCRRFGTYILYHM